MKIRILLFVVILLFGFSLIALSSQIDVEKIESDSDAMLFSVFDGEGTFENPYLISTVTDLQMLAVYVNNNIGAYGSACYRLTNNIDFNGAGFVPIGKAEIKQEFKTDDFGELVIDENGSYIYENVLKEFPFSGSFDGNGYAIKNFVISSCLVDDPNSEQLNYVGFFGYGKNASVTDLKLDNITIYASGRANTNVGVLFGRYIGNWNNEDIKITGCHISGQITVRSNKNASAGGIIGVCEVKKNYLDISDCYVNITLDSSAVTTSYVGGLIGNIETGVYLHNNVVVGSVKGEATGNANSYAGGISARICFNDWISAASTGTNMAVLAAVTDLCLAENNVVSVELQSIGQYTPRIGNCFANVVEATIRKCYYDLNYKVTGTLNSHTGIGKTREQLFDRAFLEGTLGFDFQNKWIMDSGEPGLRFKDAPCLEYNLNENGVEVMPTGCSECIVVLAMYDNDGRMIDSSSAIFAEEVTSHSFVFDENAYGSIKMFMLDLVRLSPLDEVVVIK